MKILMVNKFYYIKGGSETYYFALKRKLEEDGNNIIDFSMKDDNNLESPYKEFFVDNVDYSGKYSLVQKIRIAKNIIYSKEAKNKFEKIVVQEKPDIVHLHIFQHQISPSILDVCKKYNIPTVYTAHDLKMICLNYKMMHHGKVCEDCKDGHLYHCALNRCVKDSFLKSCINVIEGYTHKWRNSYAAIDFIITPSRFYREKFIEFGILPHKVIHIPNFLDRENPSIDISDDNKKYYLYFGRLSEEKGIMTLIKAAEKTKVTLFIVGKGPLKNGIENYLRRNKISKIKLLGFKSGQELTNLIGNAKAVVLPSEWYENGPYSAIEALQVGRPIIGSEIGGVPELVDGNGFLFKMGDVNSLVEKISSFENLLMPKYEEFENKSRDIFLNHYTWEVHKKALYTIYNHAIEKHATLGADSNNLHYVIK